MNLNLKIMKETNNLFVYKHLIKYKSSVLWSKMKKRILETKTVSVAKDKQLTYVLYV